MTISKAIIDSYPRSVKFKNMFILSRYTLSACEIEAESGLSEKPGSKAGGAIRPACLPPLSAAQNGMISLDESNDLSARGLSLLFFWEFRLFSGKRTGALPRTPRI